MSSQPIRIGNGAGFWGDNLDAPYLLARDGRLDVLTLEYLAELTLAILSHMRSRDPTRGYVTDFPELIERLKPVLNGQDSLQIVTNAGGLNPSACASVCGRSLTVSGLGKELIGVVDGDDLIEHFPIWTRDGLPLDHMETGRPISDVIDQLISANAYLGARPIAEALINGARIVITGRVADASLTLGPAAARHGWRWDDWDRLAGASAAGHVVECGAQATGGLWHDWEHLTDLAGIGYPIAEVAFDGSSIITKPEGTGGLVTVGTVAEQLVYEIDDPSCYRTPDVDVDLTTIRLEQTDSNRVGMDSTRGRPPSDTLKVAAVYRDGWTASGMLAVVGKGAEVKARAAGKIVLDRVRRAGYELDDSLVECLGAGDIVRGIFACPSESFEVMLRITVRDIRRAAVERFCREFAPLVTSGPPGIAGYATGRPAAKPAFGYWPTLVPRSLIEARMCVRPAADWSGHGE